LFATHDISSNTFEITNRNHAVPDENISQMLVTSPAMLADLLIQPSMPTKVHCTDVDAFNVATPPYWAVVRI
jgi:hypothetical protein